MSLPTRKRFTEDAYRKEPWFRALSQALLTAKTEEEMSNLLRDIGTLSELQAWAERFEVAKQLSKGLSYREVARITGASTTTVTRVAKFIENGTGGYRKIFNVHRHHRMHPVKDDSAAFHVRGAGDKHPSVLQKYLDRKN